MQNHNIKALRTKYRTKGMASGILDQIVNMYRNARSPSSSTQGARALFEQLLAAKPSKTELLKAAEQVDAFFGGRGSISDIIKRMQQSVLNRIGDKDRTRQ